MQNKLAVLMLLMLIPMFVACNEDTKGKFQMIAIVNNISDVIEVDVVESDIASGVYLVIYSKDTQFYNSNGESTQISDLKVGDKIKITYGGQVMLSYPPKIVASKISILES